MVGLWLGESTAGFVGDFRRFLKNVLVLVNAMRIVHWLTAT